MLPPALYAEGVLGRVEEREAATGPERVILPETGRDSGSTPRGFYISLTHSHTFMSTLDSQLLKIYYYGLCTRPGNGRARPPHSARARARTRVVFGRLEEREIPLTLCMPRVYGLPCFFAGSELRAMVHAATALCRVGRSICICISSPLMRSDV